MAARRRKEEERMETVRIRDGETTGATKGIRRNSHGDVVIVAGANAIQREESANDRNVS